MDVESSLVRTMARVREDGGPFVVIANAFSVNNLAWMGASVASPTALYLLKVTQLQPSSGVAAGGAVGGLVGALVGAAIDAARPKPMDETASTCVIDDLPEAIRGALDPKGKQGGKGVIVVPRSTMKLVKMSGLAGVIWFHVGSDAFLACPGIFKKGKVRTAMEAMGWSFNTALVPTEAPVHDTRAEGDRPKAQEGSKAVKMVGIVVVTIILVGLLVAAILANTMR